MVKKKNGLLSVLVALYVETTIAVFGKFFVNAVINRVARSLTDIYLVDISGNASPRGRPRTLRRVLAG